VNGRSAIVVMSARVSICVALLALASQANSLRISGVVHTAGYLSNCMVRKFKVMTNVHILPVLCATMHQSSYLRPPNLLERALEMICLDIILCFKEFVDMSFIQSLFVLVTPLARQACTTTFTENVTKVTNSRERNSK
jgi:hypothetical protein